MTGDPRTAARERTRREVAAALAPRFHTCPVCGKEDLTSSRVCTSCGAAYSVVAARRRVGRRPLLIAAGLAGGAVLAVLLLISPAVDRDKRRSAAAERRQAEAARAARDAELRDSQRPRTGSLSRPAATPSVRERRALVAGVEAAVLRDARDRIAAGDLRGPVLAVSCEPYPRTASGNGPETRLSERVGRYQCLAATSRIRPTPSNPAGAIGYPYLARVDFESFRYAFCKVSPPPGEKAVPRPGAPGVPSACSAP